MSRVLVIDDSLAQLNIAVDYISSLEGVEVEAFSSPVSFLEAAMNGPKADLLVVDLMMQSIDGVALLRVLRSKGVTTKAVLVSDLNDNTEAVAKLVPQNNVSTIIKKPLRKSSIVRQVKSLLGIKNLSKKDEYDSRLFESVPKKREVRHA